MKYFLIYLSIVFITYKYNSVFCQQIPVLNLTPAIENLENFALSDFVKSITYVPLATTYDCLVDNNPKVFVTKEFIMTITTLRCLLFDRKTGDFIREIGKNGRGPGEYMLAKGFFNEHIPAYYFTGWNGHLVKYELNGVFMENIIIPDYNDSFSASSFPMNYSFLNDSILVCDFLISNGTESKLLMLFNEKGRIQIF
jgi:hypothetical protein